MHTLVEVTTGANGSTHVPAFLAKLWKIVDDPTTNDLICWSEVGMGNSFIIRNQAKFARDLLPLYYKHNNMASFVRQLNMYGFHKVVSVEQGGLRVEKDEMEFAHPFFLRGQEGSLELIKRKIPATKHEDTRSRPDSLNKVLLDVRQMKGRQESMDSKLVNMKRENEALWRELSSLRQKHAKQTQIVSKLLQFLVGMMSSQTHRLGFKRRMPLMLNDTAGAKPAKINRTKNGGEITGPVIHDVTELFECEDGDEGDERSTEYENGDDPSVESPLSGPSKSPYPDAIYGLGSADETADMLLSVDPMSINPAISVKKDAKKSVKKPPKENPAEVNYQTQIQQQLLQQNTNNSMTAAPSTMTQNLPTYFLAGVDDNGQVILTIPEDQSSLGMNSNMMANSAPQNNIEATATANDTPSNVMVPVNMENAKQRNPVVNANKFLKPKYESKEDFDDHLDSMQNGLDNLRDLLKAEQYSIDSSTLVGVGSNNPFNMHNSIDPLTVAKVAFYRREPLKLFGEDNHGILDLQEQQLMSQQQPALSGSGDGNDGQVQVQNSELVSYNPSLFELTEDDTNFFDEATNMYLDDELNSMMTTERDQLNKGNGYSPLTFTEVTMGNPPVSLNTPVSETEPSPSFSSVASTSGAGKRKRK